jgi:tetratricopeptide (TPR) repeat protein
MTQRSKAEEATRKVFFLIERRRFKEAGQLLGTALLSDPEDIRLRYAGVLLDFEQGQRDRAKKDAGKLLLQSPKNEATRYLLFRICLEQGDRQQALEQINILCQAHPENAEYAASRAALFLQTENFAEATNEAKRALQLDPTAKAAQEINAYTKLATSDTDGLYQHLAERLRSNPDGLSTRHLLLTALYARDQYQEALKVAQTMLRENPHDKELLTIVKEFQLLAHPVPWIFRPLHLLEQRGISRSIVIGVSIIIVLKSALHGYLPPAFALPVLIYLALASLYPVILRRFKERRKEETTRY